MQQHNATRRSPGSPTPNVSVSKLGRSVTVQDTHIRDANRQAGNQAMVALQRLGHSHGCVTVPQARPQHVHVKSQYRAYFHWKKWLVVSFTNTFLTDLWNRKYRKRCFGGVFVKGFLALHGGSILKSLQHLQLTHSISDTRKNKIIYLTSLPKSVGKRKGDK